MSEYERIFNSMKVKYKVPDGASYQEAMTVMNKRGATKEELETLFDAWKEYNER